MILQEKINEKNHSFRVQDTGRTAMRTLYDGFTFEVIRDSETFQYGGFTVKGSLGIVAPSSPVQGSGDSSRFRYVTEGYSTWLPDGVPAPQGRSSGEVAVPAERKYVGISATLWANGEAVAVNRYDTATFTGGTVYLGKDLMGSVRGVTNDYGLLEERYEYDAFGKPYKGDLNGGMNLGYTGKPYDTATGLYNYGYRDYKPEVARFTTIDPIRDGANWFAYVNNDPVNWVDILGLLPGDTFSSVEAAAMDFGHTFNDDSIRNNIEYGASVYYDPLKDGYTYTNPARGTKDSVLGTVDQINPTQAQLHTHAAYDKNYQNNVFSTDDKNLADKANVPSYVATPNGSLLKYDPDTMKPTTISTNLPSDINDPSRKNTNDPNNGIDNRVHTVSVAQSVLNTVINTVFGNHKETQKGGCAD
jgi:RHS repeat-associated protein